MAKASYPRLWQPSLRFVSLIAPAIPAPLLFYLHRSLINKRVAAFLVAWLTLVVATLLIARYHSSRSPQRPHGPIYVSYFVMCFTPVLLSGIWLVSGPFLHSASLTICAVSSLLPLSFTVVWEILNRHSSTLRWTDGVLLPVISFAVTLLALEAIVTKFLTVDHFGGDATANSADRSYWYIVRKMDANGANLANSFGFLGPEPAADPSGIRVLLIGDSIPAAGRSINFPQVAQASFEDTGRRGQIEIVNASQAGYSFEQMKRYYSERLSNLEHHVLLVSFYIDDVNRELRYRKGNYLYTPSWPEWMQDVYYKCALCNALLYVSGFRDHSFLQYRKRSREDSLPSALKTLDEMREIAAKRGAVLAVFNIPRFNWSGVLTKASDYRFSDMNRRLEAWCKERDIYYRDVLPALLGRDVEEFRIDARDIHFNDLGHQAVGAELKDFLDTVVAAKMPPRPNRVYDAKRRRGCVSFAEPSASCSPCSLSPCRPRLPRKAS